KLEDIWIKEFRNQGKKLYNVKGGSAGSTARFETTGYGKREVHEKIRFLLSHGFKYSEMLNYIGFSHKWAADMWKEATGISEFRLARLHYAGERMFELMDDGIFDLDELATHFRGMDTHEVFKALASKDFLVGNEYLKGWLTAKYLKVCGDSYNHGDFVIFKKYLEGKGIQTPIGGSFDRFRIQEFLWEHYKRQDFIPLLRFYASMIIKDHDTIYGFLNHLGLITGTYTSPTRDGMHIWELESIVIDLFGYDFDTAKDIYSGRYFGHLSVLITGS
ncbi:MAG: hypothetical protein KAW51_03700, partial [Candidatus Lokiarchaeota archaeon]|nr:hypothetical protein [Candidatus Lokiarchaeota archaeon]